MTEESEIVVSKRDDPNYSQISGHIPTQMAMEFKIACTKRRVSHSEGLEQAIELWLNQGDKQEETLSPDKKGEGEVRKE